MTIEGKTDFYWNTIKKKKKTKKTKTIKTKTIKEQTH